MLLPQITTIYEHSAHTASLPIASWLREGLRQLTLLPAMHLLLHVEVAGLNNLSGGGPFVFAANHTSHLDAPLLLAALPLHLRMRTRVAAAADYFFSDPLKGFTVATLLNAFPFERKGAGSVRSLLRSQKLIDAGQSLLIFPEGTRSTDGRLHTFKHGIGKMVLATGASVIPTRIDGTFAAFPKGARRLRHRHVTITFGLPLKLTSIGDAHTATTMIEQAVHRLEQEEK